LNKVVLRLAIRFALGDRRHFFLPLLAITVAVMGMIVVFSVIRGFDKSLIDTMTGFYPHVISLTSAKLDNAEGYRMVFYETVVQTQAGFKGALVFGIEEKALKTRFKDHLKLGHFPMRGECLIGEELAKEQSVSLGDTISLFEARTPTQISQKKFLVSGIVSFGLYQYDSRSVILNIEDAEKFQPGFFAYYLDDPLRADEVARGLRKETGTVARSWLEMNSTYAKALKVDQVFAVIITIFIVALSGFGVSNSVLYSVLTRRKQVGILISLGMEPSKLRMLFILMPLIISLMGVVLGSVAGIVVALLLRLIKIPLPEDVFLTNYLPVALRTQDVLVASGLVMLIAVVFSALPSSIAAKTDPAEVLRSE